MSKKEGEYERYNGFMELYGFNEEELLKRGNPGEQYKGQLMLPKVKQTAKRIAPFNTRYKSGRIIPEDQYPWKIVLEVESQKREGGFYPTVVMLKSHGIDVQTGVFGAHMDITLEFDGPVNIVLESRA